ncbi:MAG: outer membrane protein assembly factor BamD [Planctomycetes bacterium]|nr:outer membrane protein assembly factor BamD [Planctomycetota bacterium]
MTIDLTGLGRPALAALLAVCLLTLSPPGPIRADDESGDRLLGEAQEHWEKQEFAKAAVAYRSLRDRFPKHSFVKSGEAQFWLWCSLGSAGKHEEEIAEIGVFLKKFPEHASCDYSLLFLGIAHRDLGRRKEAKAAWEELLRRFPKSQFAEQARQELEALEGRTPASPATAEGDAFEPEFIDAAEGAARWLMKIAEPRGEGLVWPEYEGEKVHKTNFYDGLAGICLFFLNMHRITGKPEYLETARKVARGLLDSARKERVGLSWEDEDDLPDGTIVKRTSSGLYTGTAGIGSVLLAMHEYLDEPAFPDDAARAAVDGLLAQARSEKGALSWGEDTDIISGGAGIGLFLLQVSDATADAKYKDAAKAAANGLIKQAEKVGDGYRWRSTASLDRYYTGFSHGTAGVAYFLLQVFARTQDKRYLEYAEGGARWLLREAAKDGAGLKWPHYQPGAKDTFMSGWCHGPAGTARFFLALHAATRNDKYLEAAKGGAEWLMASLDPSKANAPFFGMSMCCGAAGVGDYLLDLFLAPGEERYLAYAARVGRFLIAHAKRDADGYRWTNCETPDDHGKVYYATGHMTGTAGVASFLLRLEAVCRGAEQHLVPLSDRPRSRGPQTIFPSWNCFVLSSRPEGDPWGDVAQSIALRFRGELLRFDPSELSSLRRRMATYEPRPRYVSIVLPPQDLDVNLHRRMLVVSTQMDSDPFCDFAFGYITGETPDHALGLIESASLVKQHGIKKSMIEASVISGSKSYVSEGCGSPLAEALGYSGEDVYWACVEDDPKVLPFVKANIGRLSGKGIVGLSGNGDPEGIWLFHDDRNSDESKHWPFDPKKVGNDPKGEMPRILASAFRSLDLSKSVIWSGTCHSGVPCRQFVEGDIVSTFGTVDRVTEYLIPPERGLCLAILHAKPSAFLAPIGPNHGYSCNVEQYRALATGMPLGDVMRTRYNEIVLAQGGPLRPAIFRAGAPEVHEDPMRGGGINRLLYGDPAFRPFARPGAESAAGPGLAPGRNAGGETVPSGQEPPPWNGLAQTVNPIFGREGFVVRCVVVDETSAIFWDMFGSDDAHPERVYTTVDLTPRLCEPEAVTATAKSPTGEVISLAPKCLWAIEAIDGKRVLHLQANAAREALEKKGVVVEFTVLSPRQAESERKK